MFETSTTPDPKQLLEEIQALRARVHELEQALGARSDRALAPRSAASAPSADARPASNPFSPYQFVAQERGEGVAALGEQHEIRYCNQRLTTMLKAPYSELLDRPFVDIVAPQHQARFRDLLASDQDRGAIDVALVTSDNHHVPVHLKRLPSSMSSRYAPFVLAAVERKRKDHESTPRQPFSELFQLSPVALFLSRLEDGLLFEVNDRFLQLTGYRRDQVIGKSGLELGLWPSAEERATVVQCLQNGDSVHHFVGPLRTQRGDWRDVLLSASLMVREGESFVVGMLEDVTVRKREHGVVDFQAQLLANVQDAVIAFDLNQTITYWNSGAEQIYGWKAGQVLGKDLHHLVRASESRQKIAETLRLVQETGRIFLPGLVHHRRDGTSIDVEGTIVAIRGENGEIQAFASSFRDVTERKRADEALRKSEEKFAKMFQASTTAMVLTTRDGVALDVNDSMLHLVGYRREDFVGRNVLELDVWPNLIVAARIGVMIAAGQPVRNVDVQWRTGPGENKDVLLSVEPIEVNGKICLLGMATDITDRKRAEQEIRALNADLEQRVAERTAELKKTNHALKKEIAEREQTQQALTEAMQRLKAHTDNSPLALVEFDAAHRVTTWSAGAERMFGWSAAEVLGKRIQDLPWVYDADAEKIATLGREMLAGHQLRNVHTNRNYRKDGSMIECEWYNSALLDSSGKLISVRSQVLDITERKQAKEQIEALNRHLEQRAKELEFANAELESFSYSVSHDLRAPLAAVTSFTRLLLADYSSQLTEEGQRYLGLIQSNAQQMEELVTSLLALARLSRHALKKEQVNMMALVQEALETLGQETNRPNLTIEVKDMPEAEADPILLKQVWVNLIANALKFTRQREQARIQVGSEQWAVGSQQWSVASGQWSAASGEEPRASDLTTGHPPLTTVYYVRDNGVGFDMNQASRLFQVFQRLHSEEEYEGTGVGLATVARIIQRHGGRVWAEGQVDEGATFYFTLG